MQRYRDKKIRVCDKNSIPLLILLRKIKTWGDTKSQSVYVWFSIENSLFNYKLRYIFNPWTPPYPVLNPRFSLGSEKVLVLIRVWSKIWLRLSFSSPLSVPYVWLANSRSLFPPDPSSLCNFQYVSYFLDFF